MKNSKANKHLKSLFSEMSTAQISNSFKLAQDMIQNELKLPSNVKLSGLTFQHVEEGASAMECEKMCNVWIPPIPPETQGHWHVYCCNNLEEDL